VQQAEAIYSRFIESERLRLVAATIELMQADLAGQVALSQALDAIVPAEWPPELFDRPAVKYGIRQLQHRAEAGWSFWYLLRPENGKWRVLGVCGFKGRPDEQGSVEIGYSILHPYRSKGYASEAVSRLVEWAFTHHTVNEVSAETFPHLSQSIRVLEKNGFRRAGAGSEYGVIRFAIGRGSLR
jgi:RimJ/RimL family protein N-acetyltransferase